MENRLHPVTYTILMLGWIIPLFLGTTAQAMTVKDIQNMGREGNTQAIPQLISIAESSDDKFFRRAAISAIGQIKGTVAVDALASLMSLEEAYLRVKVAQAFDQTNENEAIPYLAQMTNDPEKSVSGRALAAVKTILRKSDPEIAQYAIAALEDTSSNKNIRLIIIESLIELGSNDSELSFIEACDDPDPAISTAAYKGLVVIGGMETISFLTEKMIDADDPKTALVVQIAGQMLARSNKAYAAEDNEGADFVPAPDSQEMADMTFQIVELLDTADGKTLTNAIRAAQAGKRIETVPSLVAIMREVPESSKDAYTALKIITGQNIAADADAWAQWVVDNYGEESGITIEGISVSDIRTSMQSSNRKPVQEKGSILVYVAVFLMIVAIGGLLAFRWKQKKDFIDSIGKKRRRG